MVYFHDIITPVSGKGILQSYEAEWPLLSLTINDEHTLAMGDSKGISFFAQFNYCRKYSNL